MMQCVWSTTYFNAVRVVAAGCGGYYCPVLEMAGSLKPTKPSADDMSKLVDELCARGWKKHQIASVLDVDKTTLWRWCNGEGGAPVGYFYALQWLLSQERG